MLGFSYFKAEPGEYARLSANGNTKKEGPGISGFYMPHRTSIELVGLTTVDQPFSFQEVSSDNQEVSLQGGFLYRVAEPGKLLSMYDFSIDPKTKQHLQDAPFKLPEHMLQLIRSDARRVVQGTPLEQLLLMSDDLSGRVSESVLESPFLTDRGIEMSMLYFATIQPSPQIAKALGAEYREGLLQRADEATYKRRAMAVEQERTIRENELQNEIELENRRAELL
ncbi:SPFH domain-containing protein [Nanoarchaeota archaeon]